MARQRGELRYAVRVRVLARYFGQLCLVLSVLTLVPLSVSIIYGDRSSVRYLMVIGAAVLCGSLARLKAPRRIQVNEGLVIVASVFLYAPLLMTLPITAAGMSFVDALFEAVSGSTTTGLSTRPSVEEAPGAFLFARAWMQWYGGLGIVVLSLALLFQPGRSAKGLTVAEADPEDLPGSTRAHARRVLFVYCLLTTAGILVLWLLGAEPLDAVRYSFAAVSTGGFAAHDDSLAGLGGLGLQIPVIVLCVLCAMPLTLFRRHGNTHRTSLDGLQGYGLLACGVLTAVLLGAGLRFGAGMSWADTLRNAPLLAFSAQTTAGFSTTSVAELDAGSKLLLILSMLVGGSAGSTAGGFKVVRLLILLRLLQVAVVRTSLPQRAVLEPRLGGRRLNEIDLQQALLLVLLYPLLAVLSWAPFVFYGYDPLDSLFEVVSAIGTVGLSTGLTDAGLPAPLKLVLCADMLLGRLECVAWLVFFSPATWLGRRRKET